MALDQREELYAYLKEKAKRRQGLDDRLASAQDSYASGNLANTLMESASMMGSLGGKRADVGTGLARQNEGAYAAAKDRYKMASAGETEDEDYALKRQKLMADLTEKSKKKYDKVDNWQGSNGEPLRWDEESGTYEPVPGATGFKRVEKPASASSSMIGSWSVVPGYTDPGGSPIERNNKTGETRPLDLPKGFKPKEDEKLTDSQRNAAMYYGNAENALKALENIEGGGYRPGVKSALKNMAPDAVQGYLQDPTEQRYRQAAEDWTAAKLRLESGASIPPSEVAQQAKIYMIQPGDSDEVIAQKKAARKTALDGLRFKAGKGADQITANAAPDERKLVRKQHNKALNKTRLIYSDETTEDVDGLQ